MNWPSAQTISLVIVTGVISCCLMRKWHNSNSSTKKQVKKKVKQQVKHQQKLQRRLAQDERSRRKRIESAKQRDQHFHSLSQEQQQQLHQQNKMHKQLQQEKLIHGMENGLQVAIDLSFTAEQSLRECNSVFKQLGCAYGAMKKSTLDASIALHLTSFRGDIVALGRKQGVQSWKAHLHSDSLEEVFPKAKLVYLSPDSPNVLEELDHSCVYVVGGIVDRTVRKNETMTKAKEQGIYTARFPIREYSHCSSHILNIDTVILLLLEYSSHSDWKRAIDASLPKRFLRNKQD